MADRAQTAMGGQPAILHTPHRHLIGGLAMTLSKQKSPTRFPRSGQWRAKTE